MGITLICSRYRAHCQCLPKNIKVMLCMLAIHFYDRRCSKLVPETEKLHVEFVKPLSTASILHE